MHQFLGVDPIGLRAPRPSIYLDARRVHHAIARRRCAPERAMNPESIAARFIATHDTGRRPAGCNRARARVSSPRHRSQSSGRHRLHPRRHAEPRCHRQLPLLALSSNPTYTVGSLTLPPECGSQSSQPPLGLHNPIGSLTAARAHSLFVSPCPCVVFKNFLGVLAFFALR